ncbi:helix-turn-helix domain-containing protein [Nesterenkonia ebinurensis]|uniref:helix-turn-helix domain-containing protein n=1 Tax=Nesterenkonia ebinurensis TaxID=2608252 RepID=UPI00168AF7CC|nr:helix-turn-helix transcriptional regulator [Nesterenkonia ebinurensis]
MRKGLLHGPALKKIRELTGISQQNLAGRLLITPSYLSNLESGRKQPSTTMLPKLADELGVSIETITYVVTSDAVPDPRKVVAA